MTHEYPPNRAFDSVSISRVSALHDYGLTLRQREFMVTVMVHSGCFLERQYCEFTGTVRGQNSREFMARLLRGEEMTVPKLFYRYRGGRPAVRSFHFVDGSMRRPARSRRLRCSPGCRR